MRRRFCRPCRRARRREGDRRLHVCRRATCKCPQHTFRGTPELSDEDSARLRELLDNSRQSE